LGELTALASPGIAGFKGQVWAPRRERGKERKKGELKERGTGRGDDTPTSISWISGWQWLQNLSCVLRITEDVSRGRL